MFVSLVEEGWLNNSITKQICREYLSPLKNSDIDTIVLGCTHYPLLKTVIKETLGKDVALVDSARQVACEAKDILNKQNLLAPKRQNNKDNFCCYVSDEPDNFAKLGRKFLGLALKDVRKVSNV